MKLYKSLVAGAVLFSMANSSWAIEGIDASALGNLGDDAYKAFSEDLGSALSYKAVSPAEPLGITGFDIGVEVTGTSLQGIDEWGDAIDSDLSVLPFPKIHAHKGLPFGIDLGVVYSSLPPADLSYIGGEIRYSFVSGNVAIPAIAVRATYTKLLGVDEIDFSTKGVELTVSKGFLMLTPYAGIGNHWTSSELSVKPDVGPTIERDADPSMLKLFVGLNINLGLVNFVIETDKTGDAQSVTGKLGLRF